LQRLSGWRFGRAGTAGQHRSARQARRLLRAAWWQSSDAVELAELRRILPDASVEQYVNAYPSGFDSFKVVLANNLAEIGMPA
jgi:hypothetical protein